MKKNEMLQEAARIVIDIVFGLAMVEDFDNLNKLLRYLTKREIITEVLSTTKDVTKEEIIQALWITEKEQ